MTEWVSINEAAERLGVSEETIRRRIKRGELVRRKEPCDQGYVWQIEVERIPEEPETMVLERLPANGPGEVLEREQLRERVASLESELKDLIELRDAWQEQMRRSSEAEQQLRELVSRAQMLVQALPPSASHGPAHVIEQPAIQPEAPKATPASRNRFLDWLEGR
jgi:hypothetical protein